jgi:hypothetical protein
MKTAICISGMPRTWKQTLEPLMKNLVEPLNADIFMHSWYEDSPSEMNDIISSYNPIKSCFDKNNTIHIKDYKRNTPGFSSYNSISQYKSLWLANCLVGNHESEMGFVYDWVFRIRFDYLIRDMINISTMNELDNKNIYIPNRHMTHPWNQNQPYPRIVCDMFAFSNSKNMRIYSGVYLNIDRFYDEGDSAVVDSYESTRINGEHLLAKQLDKFNIRPNIRYIAMPGINGLPFPVIKPQ